MHHIIQTENIFHTARTQNIGMPVHIPFHVCDIGGIQHIGNGFHDIVPHAFHAQIQQILISSLQRFSSGFLKDPVRMHPVQVTVFIYCFRFKPESELKPDFVDTLGKARQSVGKFLHIDVVVAQSLCIIISRTKPSVVQNEQLTPQPLGLFGKSQQFSLIEIKHTSFPAVIQDRAFPVSPVGRHETVVDKLVQISAHPIKSLRGECHDSIRCLQGFPRRKLKTEIGRRDSLHDPGKIGGRARHGGIVIAGIDQIEPVGISAPFGSLLCHNRKSGIVLIGREARKALIDDAAVSHRSRLRMCFPDPVPVKIHHPVFP